MKFCDQCKCVNEITPQEAGYVDSGELHDGQTIWIKPDGERFEFAPDQPEVLFVMCKCGFSHV